MTVGEARIGSVGGACATSATGELEPSAPVRLRTVRDVVCHADASAWNSSRPVGELLRSAKSEDAVLFKSLRLASTRFGLTPWNMKRFVVLVLPIALALSGCGQKLSGRYEMVPDIPRMQMPKGTGPKVQRQMDEIMRKAQDINRMSLEFDGSTVKMGTISSVSEYKYRIKGQSLEVIVEAMGQKTVLPMTIEADGSITYMTLRYQKVR